MSSKAEKRRREFLKREAERKRQEELKQPWRCACGHKVPAISPICLCGRKRD